MSLHLHKGRCTGYVEYEDSADGILEVGGDETAEALLTSGVPELEAAGGTHVVDVLAYEVDADGGLGDWKGTFSFSSNWLLTNLSMTDVFPVPLSPRKIIL